MSRARGLTLLLALLVLVDLLYSAAQHYRQPLDGDVGAIVLPSPAYTPVLHDPFGVRMLSRQQGHAGSNRFFAHATELAWLRTVPGWLQCLVSPVSSVYLACALLKTAVQALLLALLAWYARRLSRSDHAPAGEAGKAQTPAAGPFWLAAALLAPLFQTAGYQGQMGIIDRSITYTFFYALPLSLLLVLLWPFFAAWTSGRPLRLGRVRQGLLLALAVYLAFHGPLVGGVVLVLLGGALLAWCRQRWSASGEPAGGKLLDSSYRLGPIAWRLGILLALLTLYSLYLGRFNTENTGAASVPLLRRYLLLPRGVWAELTSKLGLPLLVGAVLGNAWLLARRLPPTPTKSRLLTLLRGLGWFALAYLLLLPLGGYRAYRPLILRYDTLLPLTLGLLLAYGATALYLLRELAGPARRWYGAGLLAVSAIFMFADKPLKAAASNAFERQALLRLAATPGPVVRLPAGGMLMSWEPITRPELSETNARLIYHWGITPEVRRYYQQ